MQVVVFKILRFSIRLLVVQRGCLLGMHCFFIYDTAQETFVVEDLIICDCLSKRFYMRGCFRGGVNESKLVRGKVKMEGVIVLGGRFGLRLSTIKRGLRYWSRGYGIFLKYTQKNFWLALIFKTFKLSKS